MIKLVKLEICKCIKRTEFKIAFSAVFCAVFLDYAILCKGYYGAALSKVMSAYDGIILTNLVKTPLSPIVGILLPLTVSFIYSDSYLQERNWGLSNFINTRISKNKYILAKAIAIAIVSFFIIFIPLIMNMLLAIIAFPIQGHNTFGLPDYKKLSYIDPGIILNRLKTYYPYINIFIFIIIRSLFASSFALISFGMSFLNRINKYLVILSSMVINILFMVSTDVLSRIIPSKSISRAIGTNILWTNSYGNFIWLLSIMCMYFIISFILIWKGTKKEIL
ncbi:hypothetical protein [Haloimpatiens massiliensis]|uniref:hypothetical protein n=1 Tax=Haloimpatiens massiliensis TaxID=1658110 RepID=UPI000C8396D2|nr:hypothetical protein [Haloimpatiens massiliensis]